MSRDSSHSPNTLRSQGGSSLTAIKALNFDLAEVQWGCYIHHKGTFGDWVPTVGHCHCHVALLGTRERTEWFRYNLVTAPWTPQLTDPEGRGLTWRSSHSDPISSTGDSMGGRDIPAAQQCT